MGIIPTYHHEIYDICFPLQNQATKATEFVLQMKDGIDSFLANNGAGILLHILAMHDYSPLDYESAQGLVSFTW